MNILVRQKGVGRIKPSVSQYLQQIPILATNPDWIRYLKEQDKIKAVNILDEDLEVGEYEAKLTWQYFSPDCHTWFDTKDPRIPILKGKAVRLAYVKESKPSNYK